MGNTLKLGNGNWATKKDSLLAYNDENNNFKPLPFDFTRASSATVVNKAGLIETVGSGEPRIDFKDDAKGALLLEPSRTNFMTYSNGFDNVAWDKGGGGIAAAPIVTANQGISPDGSNNAFKLELNLNGGTTSSDRSRLTDNFTGVTSTNYTFSFYAKAYSSSDIGKVVKFAVDNSSGDALFTLTSKWKRFVFVGTSTGTNINQHIQLRGNESTSDSVTMLLYGYQVEQGSYATSYIPTSGSAVTRIADSSSQTVPDGVIGQTEGTVYFESTINGLQGGDMRFQLSDGSTNNWIFLSSGEATGIGVKARAYINNGNVNQFNSYSAYLSEGNHKYALAYNLNDIAFYVDGVQVALDNSATIPSCDEITLSGSAPTSINASHFLSYKDTKLYNTRLSNSELAALTTI